MGSALQVERFRPATLQETIAVSCEGRRHRSYRRQRGDLPPIGGGVGITFDAALGNNTGGSVGSVAVTTTSAAAANARVVVLVSWFNPSATMSCTVGATAATKDKQFDNGSDHLTIFSLVVAGGLASGSTITATSAAGSGGFLVAACSYLGTTGVDTSTQSSTTGTGFSSGSVTNAVADSVFVGGAGNETAATSVGGTNTNGTSRFDLWRSFDGQGMRMLDLIVAATGAQALTGTWASTSTATTGAVVIYSGAAAPASPAVPMTNKYARMRARRR